MTDSTKTDLKQGTTSRRTVSDPAWREDLREGILAPENLRKAWHQVKAKHGAPGVDGMTIEEFPACAREHWARIRQAVRDETYQPSPTRRTEIPKRQGKGTRLLGIPTVGDRIIQQAIAQGLGPLCDPECSASSCGCRPGRSDILLEASSPRVLVCHNPRLARVRTRGYSPPNECVLTSGAWAISTGPGHSGYSSTQTTIDILPNDIPFPLNIALKYDSDDDCYIFSTESVAVYPDGRDPRRKTPRGSRSIHVHLMGVGVDRVFVFTLKNPGVGGTIDLLCLSKDA